MNKMFDLTGKVALVVGGHGGLGKAIALSQGLSTKALETKRAFEEVILGADSSGILEACVACKPPARSS